MYGDASKSYTNFMISVMEEDLIKANQNRANVPWIIIVDHYPMYCSDNTDSQCGSNNVALKGFAELFAKYNVEIYMSAHQHSYERDSPFFNNKSASYETDGP